MDEETKKHLTQVAKDWVDANTRKNKGTSDEKKQRKILESSIAKLNELETFEISDTLSLEVGWKDEQTEEVDAQKLFKENPNLFWSLVTVSKTALESAIGDKGAAKLMRPVTKNTFKINKIKKSPTNTE